MTLSFSSLLNQYNVLVCLVYMEYYPERKNYKSLNMLKITVSTCKRIKNNIGDFVFLE